MASWLIFAKWYSHDRIDWHWKFICICNDAESLGVVQRALEAAGQELKIQRGV